MKMQRLYVCCFLLSISTKAFTAWVTVATNEGDVKGSTSSSSGHTINIFKGIPYAKPPVGQLRFKKSEPVEKWAPTTIHATAFRPACIQPSNLPPVNESYRQHPTVFSEDCLYLNIWAPSTIAGSDVFVWFHGGGFLLGSVTIGLFDGLYFAGSKGITVVSVNYRLGPLGFGFLGPDTIPGNMGLWDQQLALSWIKANIGYFRGNPHSITILGHEAGAASVGLHLLAPSSHPFFKKAVLLSGSPIADWAYNSAETARSNTQELGEILACPVDDDAELWSCFKDTDIQNLTDSQLMVVTKGLAFAPVVDGEFLPDHPLTLVKTGAFKNTSILLGVVKDEATLFLLPLLLQLLHVNTPPPAVDLTEAQYLDLLTSILSTQKNQINATVISSFYVGGELPPGPTIDYLSALNLLWSDLDMKCPVTDFAAYYTKYNPVYQYSFEHRTSVSPFPDWVGVAHSYELEFFLGSAQYASHGFSTTERSFGQSIKKYLANFVKSGTPNSPQATSVTWPQHEEDKEYLILKAGNGRSVSTALRHAQCNFLNNILPLFEPMTVDPIESKAPKSTGVFVFLFCFVQYI